MQFKRLRTFFYWFEKRFGLSVFNYMVISNHVHFLSLIR